MSRLAIPDDPVKSILVDLIGEIACRPLSEEEAINLMSALDAGRLLALRHPEWLVAVLGAWEWLREHDPLADALLDDFVADHPVEGVTQ